MLLRLFKGNHPSVIILIVIFAGLIWLRSLITIPSLSWEYEPNPMPLYTWLLQINVDPLIYRLLGLIFMIINAFYLARFNTKFMLIKARTNLPAVLFIIISSSFIPILELHPVMFACILFLFSLDIMFVSYKKEELTYYPFEASLLISLASMFYAKAAFFMIIIWIGLFLLRPFLWREWIYTAIGFLLPYGFLFSCYYLLDYDLSARFKLILQNFSVVYDYEYLNYTYHVFYAFLLLLVILASVTMIRFFKGLKIYARRFFSFLFWIFILIIIMYFLMFTKSMELLLILAIPVSMILTFYFFSLRNKILGEILFTVLIGLLTFVIFIN